jgi:hypothetical protein
VINKLADAEALEVCPRFFIAARNGVGDHDHGEFARLAPPKRGRCARRKREHGGNRPCERAAQPLDLFIGEGLAALAQPLREPAICLLSVRFVGVKWPNVRGVQGLGPISMAEIAVDRLEHGLAPRIANIAAGLDERAAHVEQHRTKSHDRGLRAFAPNDS